MDSYTSCMMRKLSTMCEYVIRQLCHHARPHEACLLSWCALAVLPCFLWGAGSCYSGGALACRAGRTRGPLRQQPGVHTRGWRCAWSIGWPMCLHHGSSNTPCDNRRWALPCNQCSLSSVTCTPKPSERGAPEGQERHLDQPPCHQLAGEAGRCTLRTRGTRTWHTQSI